MRNGNGATSGGKLLSKLASTADAVDSGREALTKAAALSSLAVVSSLLSQLIVEICNTHAGISQELAQRTKALTKVAVETGSEPERILKAVLPEIESTAEKLEHICSAQLSFWMQISQRMAGIRVLRKVIQSKSNT
jgi:hypothetical protein